MLHRILKKKLPGLSQILDNLGNPSAAQLAAALDVSPRTAARWIAADLAPRPAMLALYWVTSWGGDEVNCAAINDARAQYQLALSWRSRAEQAEAQIARLLRVGDFGASNSPMLDVRPMAMRRLAAGQATR